MGVNKKVYEKIENVIGFARKPLAAHEFREIADPVIQENGLAYVGVTEATLGRRMREMVALGRLSSTIREGKSFKEYRKVVKKAEQAEFPDHQVAA